MRTYLETKVPLGHHRLLTYMLFNQAALWGTLDTALTATPEQTLMKENDRLRTALADSQAQVGLSLCFGEQVAMDNGRLMLGWLLSSHTDPPFHITSRNVARQGLRPFSRLSDPRWMAANLAFLKDMDYLESRSRTLGD